MDCDCTEPCGMADQFIPATRELMVFTKRKDRYFDLDAVREPYAPLTLKKHSMEGGNVNGPKSGEGGDSWNFKRGVLTHAGAPPLDWWLIPYTEPNITPRQGESMSATFYVGDCIEVMSKLPEKSVDLILTSPPFLALRSYLPADHPDKALEGGSQSTPGEFIDWLLDVVDACARVLAPHGSLVFELGDTYSGSGGAGGDYAADGLRDGQPRFRQNHLYEGSNPEGGFHGSADMPAMGGVPYNGGRGWPLAKSLSLIPESFRWAMVYGRNPFTGRTCDTWRLRNVIRWVRPNPPVGALGDKFRPATSELMVFCKAKDRFFDLDAVREQGTNTQFRKVPHGGTKGDPNGGRDTLGPYVGNENPAGAPPLDWWNIPPGGYSGAHYAVFPPELLIKPIKAMTPERVCRVCGEPSRRISEAGSSDRIGSVLRKAREAAGMSQKDVAAWFPSVTGGTTGCVWNWENGANVPMADQWERLKEGLGISDEFDYLIPDRESVTYADVSPHPSGNTQNAKGEVYQRLPSRKDRIAADRFSDCSHDDWRPGLVLDPFGGSGTTALVATGHGRDCILIDLDSRNYDLALERVGPFILTRGEIAE